MDVFLLQLDFCQHHQFGRVVHGHQIDLVYEAALPVGAHPIIFSALQIDVRKQPFQPIAGKLRILLPEAIFQILSVGTLQGAAVTVEEREPESQEGIVQLVVHRSAARPGIEGTALGNQAVILFQTLQMASHPTFQDGFYLHSGGLSAGDQLQDGKIDAIIPAKLLDQQVFTLIGKDGVGTEDKFHRAVFAQRPGVS